MGSSENSTSRCAECPSHSGIEVRVATHAEILKTLDTRMNILGTKMDNVVTNINDRFFHIMIGVILCLMTGLISILLSLYTMSNSPPQFNSSRGTPQILERAILTESIVERNGIDEEIRRPDFRAEGDNMQRLWW